MLTDSFMTAAFSSETCQWDSPPDLVVAMSPVFDWDLDVCADSPNVCSRFYSPADDGLAQPWRDLCWMNPPYGREIPQWVERASMARPYATTVCLLPARTDTAWWQDTVPYASQVVFIRGRLTFGSDAYWAWRWEQPTINGKPNSLYRQYGKKQSAPFPSAFVVFGAGLTSKQVRFLNGYGWNPRLNQ